MKIYIGLGGIGCRVLQDYSDSLRDKTNKEFFYVDSDRASAAYQKADDYYIVSVLSCGSSMMRRIGYNSMIYELFVGKADSYFSKVRVAKNVELVFVVSSFGGFGSAAVFPVLDYLESIVWKELVSCEVIAFNENAYKRLIPKAVNEQFESNTLEFVHELLMREQSANLPDYYDLYKAFNPICSSFLIDTASIAIGDFWKCIDLAKSDMSQLDCKKNYYVKPPTTDKPVFISYSTKDQKIADMIVDELMRNNIEPWISSKDMVEGSYPKQIMQALRKASVFLVLVSKNATNSGHVKNEVDRAFNRIKDGMIIIPFIIDEFELDDELSYYLCRQEMISGTKPPLQERIRFLVDRIQSIISNF